MDMILSNRSAQVVQRHLKIYPFLSHVVHVKSFKYEINMLQLPNDSLPNLHNYFYYQGKNILLEKVYFSLKFRGKMIFEIVHWIFELIL